jgi:uncharacterized OsmC-like protein
MTTETATTIRNGIDVDQLLATIEAVKRDPAVGTFTFKATSRWQNGTHNTGDIGPYVQAGTTEEQADRSFKLDGDEPPVLLGSNKGPNAVELLLQALGFCYAVGYVANAAALGYDITAMDYDVEGDIDLRSFLGLEGPRAGFSEIRVKSHVSCANATKQQLEDLCQHVQDTSPVRDCLANPIPVTTTLEVH